MASGMQPPWNAALTTISFRLTEGSRYSQQSSKGKEGASSTEPKLTSSDNRVDDQLCWDPNIWSESLGDELRWQFCGQEEDTEDGVSDIVISLSKTEIFEEIVGLRGSKIGPLNIWMVSRG